MSDRVKGWLLETIETEMCDDYCRYPDDYIDEDKLIEQHCDTCPLNLL